MAKLSCKRALSVEINREHFEARYLRAKARKFRKLSIKYIKTRLLRAKQLREKIYVFNLGRGVEKEYADIYLFARYALITVVRVVSLKRIHRKRLYAII